MPCDAACARQEDRDEVDEMRKAAKAQANPSKPLEHMKEKEGSARSRIGL